VATSVTNDAGDATLDIDVNNLVKPDGTKGTVPEGSYMIKFADSETGTTYVGTTQEPITVQAAPETPSSDSDGGGGCNTGYGVVGLLLMRMALRKYRAL
jgi:hypothetical protein